MRVAGIAFNCSILLPRYTSFLLMDHNKAAAVPEIFQKTMVYMKTIFNKKTRDVLIYRINSLNENSTAQWGHMNVYQMVQHCIMFEEWILGVKKPVYKQVFIGRLFGKTALKGILKDESPLKRNTPTLPAFKIKETTGDTASGKKKWIALVESYAVFSNPAFVHFFFGKMTKEEIGYLVYKHTDHHLSQFYS